MDPSPTKASETDTKMPKRVVVKAYYGPADGKQGLKYFQHHVLRVFLTAAGNSISKVTRNVVFSEDCHTSEFTSLDDPACTLKGVKEEINKKAVGSILLYFRGGQEIRFNDSLPGSLIQSHVYLLSAKI